MPTLTLLKATTVASLVFLASTASAGYMASTGTNHWPTSIDASFQSSLKALLATNIDICSSAGCLVKLENPHTNSDIRHHIIDMVSLYHNPLGPHPLPPRCHTSQVPVPAAAYLFGSALLALLGIRKRLG